ncbi:MAG: hypothetical protein ACYDEE_17330, partial [Ignavibacteriaceae bacterium]
YDRWMMWFPKSFPGIQLGGKPVPGHATVIANKPLIYSDFLSKPGWPTKYKVHDFGNGENDSHGMLISAGGVLGSNKGALPHGLIKDRTQLRKLRNTYHGVLQIRNFLFQNTDYYTVSQRAACRKRACSAT